MIGVLAWPGYLRATVADIPGLIEGAHANRGLGHEFLRHIRRCRLLLFVVDMAGSEGRWPWDDLASLRREVSMYDSELARRSWLVVANKMDLPAAAENLRTFRQRFPKVTIVPASTIGPPGVSALRAKLKAHLARRPA
jgi:GTP-binding protein